MRTFPDLVMRLGSDKSSFSSQQYDDGKFLSHRRWLKRRTSIRPNCIMAFQIDLYLQSFLFPVEIEIQKKNRNNYSRFFILMNTMAVILTNREINSIIGTGAFRFGGHSKNGFFFWQRRFVRK